MGFGDEESCFLPERLQLPRSSPKKLALGGLHSACVSEENEVFIWGFGALLLPSLLVCAEKIVGKGKVISFRGQADWGPLAMGVPTKTC